MVKQFIGNYIICEENTEWDEFSKRFKVYQNDALRHRLDVANGKGMNLYAKIDEIYFQESAMHVFTYWHTNKETQVTAETEYRWDCYVPYWNYDAAQLAECIQREIRSNQFMMEKLGYRVTCGYDTKSDILQFRVSSTFNQGSMKFDVTFNPKFVAWLGLPKAKYDSSKLDVLKKPDGTDSELRYVGVQCHLLLSS